MNCLYALLRTEFSRFRKAIFRYVFLIQPPVSSPLARVVFIISISLFVSSTDISALERTVMRTDAGAYTIVSDKMPDEDVIDSFDRQFASQAEEVFSKIGVKIPEQFRVTICIGAWVFKKETGLDEHTAGLYYPSRKIFVFQNPKALEKRGILLKTIRHELCHSAFDEWRLINGVEYNPKKKWLEESLCTALYPADDYSISEGESLLAEMKTGENKIAAYLSVNLSSSDYKKRRKAYSLAYAYGRRLLSGTKNKPDLSLMK